MDRQRDSKREVKEGLDRDRCRKTKHITVFHTPMIVKLQMVVSSLLPLMFCEIVGTVIGGWGWGQ